LTAILAGGSLTKQSAEDRHRGLCRYFLQPRAAPRSRLDLGLADNSEAGPAKPIRRIVFASSGAMVITSPPFYPPDLFFALDVGDVVSEEQDLALAGFSSRTNRFEFRPERFHPCVCWPPPGGK